MKIKAIYALCFMLSLLAACEKNEISKKGETSEKSGNTGSRGCIPVDTELPVDTANVPATGQSGVDIPIDVFFQFPNSCFKFDSFQEEIKDNEYNIKNLCLYTPCEICSQGFVPAKRIYHFKATSPGSYILTFWKGGSNYFSSTIIIQ
jgi:hypothetical protein